MLPEPLSSASRLSESFCSASVYAAALENSGLSSSRAAGDVLVDGNVAEHVGQFTEASLLLGDAGLRVGDLLIEFSLLVLRCAVVLIELTETILEVVELVGQLIDLGLLVADTVGIGDGG